MTVMVVVSIDPPFSSSKCPLSNLNCSIFSPRCDVLELFSENGSQNHQNVPGSPQQALMCLQRRTARSRECGRLLSGCQRGTGKALASW